MEVVIVESQSEMARIAAEAIAAVVWSRKAPTLGLATGSSPVPVYADLIKRHRTKRLSFAGATMFLLDEYVGLPDGHPQSFRTSIRDAFTAHVDVDPEAVHGPDANAANLQEACLRYENMIAEAGGIDVQLLGIGSEGHIGFNEPASSLASRTRLKTLTDCTRKDNARFFDKHEEVPRQVLTQGIGTILEARHIILLASGLAKSVPIEQAVEGPVSAMVPASALQLHSHVTVIVDEHAACRLKHADYYRATFKHKPEWQAI